MDVKRVPLRGSVVVRLDVDERYPVLCEGSCGPVVEVPADLWRKFKRAEKRYNALHAEVLALYKEAK